MRSISPRAQRSGSLLALSDCNSQARRACLTMPTSIRSTARRRTRETMWVCAALQPRTRRARRTGAHPCMHEHHLAHSGRVPASIPRFRHKLEARWLAIVSCSRTSLHNLIISFSTRASITLVKADQRITEIPSGTFGTQKTFSSRSTSLLHKDSHPNIRAQY
jgi:hypothetical protein